MASHKSNGASSSSASAATRAADDGSERPAAEVDLLRFSTAGSVDDGKSTLIGRLLYDTKSIFQDQMDAIERASKRLGDGEVNLALLTDGLRAEREQKITIDVAYRYFATPRRKFIIADTPGHLQYTRNMVTGASTAELAIVLVDARNGVLTQSKRHGFISSLLRIPHVLVAVNKMDLVDYSESVYQQIVDEYREFAEKLEIADLDFIPISALKGDNVVEKSAKMPWYEGATLLHTLETVNVGASRNLVDFRFPVQTVIRPHQDYRGFAGRIASGTIAPGEEVVVLPSGKLTRVESVDAFEGALEEAAAGDSVVITVADQLDISRGDMIVRTHNLPTVASRFDATLCWMSDEPMDKSTPYVLMHTTRESKAFVTSLLYRVDVDTLHREDADALRLNEIGRVEITTAKPMFFDAYSQNRATGSFVLVDPYTHGTVAAGMIRGAVRDAPEEILEKSAESGGPVSPGVVWEDWNIPRTAREQRNGHKAAVLWFTGLSGSGKSTIAREVERALFARGCQTMQLDGDQLRHGLNGDLGFSDRDRTENIRRVGETARLFFEQGAIVLCTFVSPFASDRARARRLLPEGRFFEVFVDADLETCRSRDPKGHYGKADKGELKQFTGVSSAYEAPRTPEIALATGKLSIEESAAEVMRALEAAGII